MWRVRDPFGYHVEYAYSCMGYEIPGGLGVKRALAEAKGGAQRDVVVMVGDGSYLMMHTELVTAVAERIKLIVVLIQNHGYASIGSLSESLGSQRFGTQYRALDEEHHSFDGRPAPGGPGPERRKPRREGDPGRTGGEGHRRTRTGHPGRQSRPENGGRS